MHPHDVLEWSKPGGQCPNRLLHHNAMSSADYYHYIPSNPHPLSTGTELAMASGERWASTVRPLPQPARLVPPLQAYTKSPPGATLHNRSHCERVWWCASKTDQQQGKPVTWPISLTQWLELHEIALHFSGPGYAFLYSSTVNQAQLASARGLTE